MSGNYPKNYSRETDLSALYLTCFNQVVAGYAVEQCHFGNLIAVLL